MNELLAFVCVVAVAAFGFGVVEMNWKNNR
jgi:hypothetical protein